mmetsp:Transcript_29509/g.96109  ORF Transcript_29509/g.96109 Transcript_29509/m.96109 type:complete len:236 (-) Transcript_29509:289-996(-)
MKALICILPRPALRLMNCARKLSIASRTSPPARSCCMHTPPIASWMFHWFDRSASIEASTSALRRDCGSLKHCSTTLGCAVITSGRHPIPKNGPSSDSVSIERPVLPKKPPALSHDGDRVIKAWIGLYVESVHSSCTGFMKEPSSDTFFTSDGSASSTGPTIASKPSSSAKRVKKRSRKPGGSGGTPDAPLVDAPNDDVSPSAMRQSSSWSGPRCCSAGDCGNMPAIAGFSTSPE